MDLYTLSDQFLPQGVLDEYVSAIWTERYTTAGDFRIVVQASPENLALLAPGTYLALRGSKEVMLIETHSIENNLLTVIGRTLVVFLDERPVWSKNPTPDADSTTYDIVSDYTDDTKVPGAFISDVVNKMAINITPFTGGGTAVTDASLPEWDNEEIPNLTLGAIDTSGTAKKLTAPIGPVYQGISQVADAEGVGIGLYLVSASPTLGFSLKFVTYRGVDRTTGSTNPLMRLSPEMDSLQDLKELHSIQGFKNICYVYYKGKVTKHLLYPDDTEPEGLDRRVLVTNAEGEPPGRKVTVAPGSAFGGLSRGGYSWPGYTYTAPPDPAAIAAFREENARDAFAKHNYIHSVDGQSSPQNDYKYGVDYGLGDLVELEGITGTIAKARITEYVRTEDQTGYREYPTISIVDKPS